LRVLQQVDQRDASGGDDGVVHVASAAFTYATQEAMHVPGLSKSFAVGITALLRHCLTSFKSKNQKLVRVTDIEAVMTVAGEKQ
jgi:hypothetical protein